MAVPAFFLTYLFADDPAAVRAKISLKLLDDLEVTMIQVRGVDSTRESEGWSREKYFLFRLPVSPEVWNSFDDRDVRIGLVQTNQRYSKTRMEVPATIRLYDAEGRLIEKREYVIRSRVAEGAAE